MKERCATCAHWLPFDAIKGNYATPPVPHLGLCGRIPQVDDEAAANEVAATEDLSGMSALRVGADFGCVLHEGPKS